MCCLLQFTEEIEEDASDKERNKLYEYIRSMVRAVYSRAKVVIGIGSHAQVCGRISCSYHGIHIQGKTPE
jgi:hypothetical protein